MVLSLLEHLVNQDTPMPLFCSVGCLAGIKTKASQLYEVAVGLVQIIHQRWRKAKLAGTAPEGCHWMLGGRPHSILTELFLKMGCHMGI